jgi:hypothetical protein
MARSDTRPAEIVAKLRQVDVLVSQGQNMVDAIRQIGVSEVSVAPGVRRAEDRAGVKDLELENSRLRKAVSDLTLGSSFFRRPPAAAGAAQSCLVL